MKKHLIIAAAACFAANPNIHELHVTTDAQCFEKEHDANEHSKDIESRELVKITREEAEVASKKEVVEDDAEEGNAETKKAKTKKS